MPVRRLFAVGLWLCVTTAATAIVWAGTSTVVADLTDRPPPVVGRRDVERALVSGEPDARTAPGITTPSASGTPSTVPPKGAQSPAAAAGAPASTPSAPQTPGAVVPSPVAPVAPSAPTPTTVPSPPATRAPQSPTATYSTTGGMVTVACNGFFIDLVSATAATGYSVDVVTGGPYYIEVHFVRTGRDYPVWAFCLGQPIRVYDGPPGGQVFG